MHMAKQQISNANASTYSPYYSNISKGYNIKLFWTVKARKGKLVADRLLKYRGTATR